MLGGDPGNVALVADALVNCGGSAQRRENIRNAFLSLDAENEGSVHV